MRDNQIIFKLGYFYFMGGHQIGAKHIPITAYEEVKPTDGEEQWGNSPIVITNIGGKLYKKTIIGL